MYFLACSKCKNTVVQNGAVAACRRQYLLLEEDKKRLEKSAEESNQRARKTGKERIRTCASKSTMELVFVLFFLSVTDTMESIVMSGDSKTTLIISGQLMVIVSYFFLVS